MLEEVVTDETSVLLDVVVELAEKDCVVELLDDDGLLVLGVDAVDDWLLLLELEDKLLVLDDVETVLETIEEPLLVVDEELVVGLVDGANDERILDDEVDVR